ncbi:TnsD family Tn7-like transposition protein [Pseudomonas sp. 22373]|uniref:TnsD family Tn7-like transposition protein n=1 Tax=Pseudomonas sp. 22373 TaxID=3453914 RepID=UPI003F86467C
MRLGGVYETRGDSACSRFNLSISTVNRLLRSNPAHKLLIINNSFHILCEEQRSAWLSITNQHPSASANTIKKLIPNVYAWLYRNDRSWLMLQTKNRPSGRSGNHVAVDWEARDEKLYSLVKKVLENPTTDLQIIRKRDLYQIVPNLFSSLQQKSHYPKTRLLVFQAFP